MAKAFRNLAVATALLSLGGAMIATPAAAREKKEEAAKGPKLTESVRKQLVIAQDKIKASDWPGALEALRAAEPLAATPDDKYYIANLKIATGQGSKDQAVIKEGLEGALASGQANPEQQITFAHALGDLAFNAKDYAGATRYYQQVLQANPNDAAIAENLARLAFDNRALPPAQRMAALAQAIAVAERAGKKPEQFFYQGRLQIALDSKQTAEVNSVGGALVHAYPTPKNWESAIYGFRSNLRMDEQADLDTYRLQRLTGSLTGEGQYLDYAQTAQLRGLPGESRAVLAEGVAKKIVDPSKPSYAEISRAVPPAKVAADRASLPASEKQAASSPNGKLASATGDGYLAHADYAKAAPLYRLALTKGGVDTARVNMRLGIALGMSGDKAGSEAAFKAVSGEPRASLAKYWLEWLAQKG